MTQAALAKATGVTQAAIARIEGGSFLASDDLAAEIARRTNQPIAFFLQDSAPMFPVGSLLFRSHASITKGDIVEVSRQAEYAYELYIKLRAKLRAIPVRMPALANSEPEDAARSVRDAFGIRGNEPVPHLLNLLEWHGVVALVVPDGKSRDAFSYWLTDTPVIALSAGRSGDRARLSVAHELGHLVLHRGKSRFEVNDLEANDFAAEFLMPERAMRQEIKAPVTIASLATLKPRWRVSIQAMVVRAKDLGIITDRQYRYLFEQISTMGMRKSEPVPIAPEKPRALRQMAEMLYGDPIDVRTLAQDMCMNSEQVEEILSYCGAKEEQQPVAESRVVSFPKGRKG